MKVMRADTSFERCDGDFINAFSQEKQRKGWNCHIFGAADDMGYLRRAGKRFQFQDFSRCQQRGQHRVKFFEEPWKTEEGTRTT